MPCVTVVSPERKGYGMNIKIEGLPAGQRIKKLKFEIEFDGAGVLEIENEIVPENHFQETPPAIPPEMTDMDF